MVKSSKSSSTTSTIRYFNTLRDHANFIQVHFHGDGKNPESNSTFVPPNTTWTSSEKHVFFQALSRHSRLRPDLIAATIGTKSALEVCQYLHILRNAANSSSRAVDPRERERETKRRRVQMDAAVEVSDEWIAFEDSMAREYIAGESQWEKNAISSARKRVLKEEDTGKKVDRDEPSELRGSTTPVSQTTAWKLEDTLKELDISHLLVLDSFLRTAEESVSPTPSCPSPSAPYAENTNLTPQSSPVASSHSHPSSEPLVQQATSNSLEDLLSSMSRDERRLLRKRIYNRRRRAEQRGDVVFVEDVARLRTGRKRKHDDTQEPSEPTETLRKDLGSSADDTDSDGNVAGGGGTRSRTRGLTAREKARALFSEVGLDAAMLTGDGLDIFHLSKLGRLAEMYTGALFDPTIPEDPTRPPTETPESSQSKRQTKGTGIERNKDTPQPTLSYTIIQLLRAYLVGFIAPVIHSAIVCAEQEKRAKEHTKVWRGTFNLIKPDHVARAVKMAGGKVDKAAFFADLPRRLGLELIGDNGEERAQENKKGDDEASESGDEDLRDDELMVDDDFINADESDHGERETPPLHSSLYSPLIWHPAHIALASGHNDPDNPHFNFDIDDLGDDNNYNEEEAEYRFDSRGIAVELTEEEDLARKDARMDGVVEDGLWKYFGIVREKDGDGDREDEMTEESAEVDADVDMDADGESRAGEGAGADTSVDAESGGLLQAEEKAAIVTPKKRVTGNQSTKRRLAVKSHEYIIDSSDEDEGGDGDSGDSASG